MQASEEPVVKCPFNLPTFQRRLRHLQSIAVRNLNCAGDEEIDLCNLAVYFTLHTESARKAFYTSEKITGSLNPTWQSFGLQRCGTDLTAKSVVVRVWCGHGDTFQVKIEAEVHFSGLLFFSSKLQVPGLKHQTDTLLFGLFNNIFIYYDSRVSNLQLEQWMRDTEIAKRDVIGAVRVDSTTSRPSYTSSNLKRIHMVQRAIKQTEVSVRRIHSNIEDRLLSSSQNSDKLSQREVLLMKVRQLRRELLWQTQQKQLEQEKLEKYRGGQNARLNTLKEKGTQLQNLGWDMEEKRTLHIQSREMLVKENAQVLFRRKQIIREMVRDIYPITEDDKLGSYICGVRLPNAEDYQGQDEVRVSVALGFTCHLTQMLSHFMDLPLRYPMVHRGSRSTIVDHIHSKLAEKDREFPLYAKGKEKFQYNYAVFLLNKNISQLRFYYGLGTSDLRQTLPNLKSLLEQRLGARSNSGSEQKGELSTLQSPPPTSISESQVSRMSQAVSSAASSSTRRDLLPEQDNHLLTDIDSHPLIISRSTSAFGISLSNLSESFLPTTAPRLGHSVSFPQSSRDGPASVDNCDAHASSPLDNHSVSADSSWRAQNSAGHGQLSPARTEGPRVIKEEDESADIFTPSDDSFFQVNNQSSPTAFNDLGQEGSSSSSFTNGIIPKSDIFLDTTHRSFKLVRSSQTNPDIPSNGDQVILGGSPVETVNSDSDHLADDHPQPAWLGLGQSGSYEDGEIAASLDTFGI